MNTARWDQLQQLFLAAVDLPAHEQQAFFESKCPGDPSLLSEARAMLDADARAPA